MTTQIDGGAAAPLLDRQLVEINRMVFAGQFAEAIAAAKSLVQLPQARMPARALQALATAMSGDNPGALELLRDFPAPDAIDKSEILLALGSAWFKVGEMVEAEKFLAAGAKLRPDHPLIVARLGACLLANGKVGEAMPHLLRATELLPASGGSWLNLARAQLLIGQNDAALASLDKAEPLQDKEPDLYRMARAEALARLDRHGEADALLRQALEAKQAGAAEALVTLLGARGRHDEAWQVLREALDERPDDIELLELGAELAQVRGRFGEADRYLNRALEKDPENAALWTRRALMASRRMAVPGSGREAADRALSLTEGKSGPLRGKALVAHAHVLQHEEKHADAEKAFVEALETHPNNSAALNGLGQLLMQLGRVDEATELFEKLKKIAPLQGWSQLIHAREVPDDPAVLEQMAQAARRPSLEGPVQSNLLFTLAAAWEKKKDYERAWSFVEEANEATKAHLSYRPEAHRNHVEREIARFSKQFMESRSGWGIDSRIPTFVLGMPRSGTTLVEQILGSHTQVFGAGELSLVPDFIQKLVGWEMKMGSRREYPECVDDISQEESRRFAEKHLDELRAYAPDAQRVVDKLPHNFEHVGLIKLLFPNAKILHLKREPRDVAISNLFTDYAAKFGGMGFAYDQSWVGEQLVDHQRMMDHWHQVFPGQILEVEYDLLVEDVDGWAHRIIEFLELPWEDGVLSFQKLDRAVKTASVWQVRQPVYTTSKAKWKRYEKHLDPLEAAMAERPPAPVPMPLPKLEPGMFIKAQTLLTDGHYADAEAVYRELLNARPSHAAARHFLGAALYQQGRLPEALKEMRRSVELHPGLTQWVENLKIVEQVAAKNAERG